MLLLILTPTMEGGVGWTPRVNDSAFYAMTVVDVKAAPPLPLPGVKDIYGPSNPNPNPNPVTIFQVAGRSLGLPPAVFNKGEAIVDSGTSDACFPATAFTAIKFSRPHSYRLRIFPSLEYNPDPHPDRRRAFTDLCSNHSTCLKG